MVFFKSDTYFIPVTSHHFLLKRLRVDLCKKKKSYIITSAKNVTIDLFLSRGDGILRIRYYRSLQSSTV